MGPFGGRLGLTCERKWDSKSKGAAPFDPYPFFVRFWDRFGFHSRKPGRIVVSCAIGTVVGGLDIRRAVQDRIAIHRFVVGHDCGLKTDYQVEICANNFTQDSTPRES